MLNWFWRPAMAGALAVTGLLLADGPAKAANPCVTEYDQQVPGCVTTANQWTLSHDSTQYQWLACPPSAAYWWGSWSDTWEHQDWQTTWHSSGTPNAAYMGLRNLWPRHQWARVVIGCSPINPGCSNGGASGAFSDPGCPQSDQQQVCNGDGESQNCWNEWNETCSNGNTYSCTQALFATYCVSTNGC